MGRRAERPARPPMRVLVFGAGKVGTALAKALRARGVRTTLRRARDGVPTRVVADFIVLAVRDGDLRPAAQAWAAAGVIPTHAVVVHVAGALDAEPLAPLRGACAGVAQMHPMISFASRSSWPDVARGTVHVQGDPTAVARARRVARVLGMTPRTIPGLDTALYHAAAGLLANGGAALAALGAQLLERAGVPRAIAPSMLGPLLRSVADNVEALGFPHALTGPVRRGDASGVARHIETLRSNLPGALALYKTLVQAQLPVAEAIGEAPAAGLAAIARLVDPPTPARTRARRRPALR